MSRNAPTPDALDGIALDVLDVPHYLEALWLRLRTAFPDWGDWTGLGGEIEDLLGFRPALGDEAERPDPNDLERVIGWSAQRVLGQLVDREWLLSDKNEFEPLAQTLDRTETLAATTRPFLCAAGVCRLAAHLAQQSRIEAVECSDLSYLGLYLGRLLVGGDTERLPGLLVRPRIRFEVAAGGKSIRGTKTHFDFHRPSAAAAAKLSFRAADAFALPRPIPGDTVLVPYLVDVFDRERLTTLLIRICEALAPGQRLLLVSSLTSRRHPGQLLGPIRACGLEIHRLHLWELPYSFSHYGFGFVRRIFNTLVVEAVKASATDLSSISATFDPVPAGPLPGLRRRPCELSPRQAAAVSRAASAGTYADLRRALDDALGESLSHRFSGLQASRGGLRLSPRNDA